MLILNHLVTSKYGENNRIPFYSSKILWFFFLILITTFFQQIKGQQINTNTWEWNAELIKAQEQKKHILVDCYTEWCHWCKVMDNSTLNDNEVNKFINNEFIFLKLDMEGIDSKSFGAKYRVSGYPGYLIFDKYGKLVYRFTGFQKPESFLTNLQNSLIPETQMKFPGISTELNPGFPEKYLSLFGTKDSPYYSSTVADSLLMIRTDLFDEVSWAIIYKLNPSQYYTHFFLNNYSKYKVLYNDEAVALLNKLIHKLYINISKNKKEDELVRLENLVEKHYENKSEAAEITNYYKKEYYMDQKNWDSVEVLLQQRWSAHFKLEAYDINRDCWKIYLNCPKVSLIEIAEKKMSEMNQYELDYFNLDTHAALLSKLSRTTEAISLLKTAIKMGKDTEQDTSSSEKLLSELEEAILNPTPKY